MAELLEDPTRYLDWEQLTLAVVPSEDPEDCATDFVAVSRLVTLTGNLVFVVEEVGYFQQYCASKIDWLATQSRHHEVPCIFVAQRAVQVPKTARTQLTQLVSFRQDHPDDLKALADLAGEPFAADVSRLGRGQWRHWKDSLSVASATETKAKAK